MNIEVEKKDNLTLVSVIGRLDASTASELEDELDKTVENKGDNIIISLKNLAYISSAGLRVLISFAKKLHVGQMQLGFAALSGDVREVFEISGFYSIFTVYETVEEAISKSGSA